MKAKASGTRKPATRSAPKAPEDLKPKPSHIVEESEVEEEEESESEEEPQDKRRAGSGSYHLYDIRLAIASTGVCFQPQKL